MGTTQLTFTNESELFESTSTDLLNIDTVADALSAIDAAGTIPVCLECGRPLDENPRGKKATKFYHSSGKDDWATPRDRWEEWDRKYGPFTLDAAASASNALCEQYYTVEDNALEQPWTGRVWCNPPYSKLSKEPWLEKAYNSAQGGATVVMLIPSRTDTRYWQNWAMKGEIEFLPGRLKFGNATNGAPFPSALVTFRPPAIETPADLALCPEPN